MMANVRRREISLFRDTAAQLSRPSTHWPEKSRSPAVNISGAVKSVAKISQAGPDVFILVEFAIESCGDDWNIGETLPKPDHSFRRGDYGNQSNITCACVFEKGDRLFSRAAGGEHWVDNQDASPVKGRQFEVIGSGLRSNVVAFQSHIVYRHIWEEVGHGLKHSKSGTQDRDHDQPGYQSRPGMRFQRRLNWFGFCLQITRRFDDQEGGQG